MDNTKIDLEPRYVPIDETTANDPNIQIRIWDEQQGREVGYAGELKLIDVKFTVPLPSTYLDKFA